MIPGTTPTFVLTLKDEENHLADTKSIRVNIRQQDVLIIKKIDNLLQNTTGEGIVINAPCNKVSVFLTQNESNRFLYKKGNIEIQIHGLMNDGQTAWKTKVKEIPVDRTLSKEVIT